MANKILVKRGCMRDVKTNLVIRQEYIDYLFEESEYDNVMIHFKEVISGYYENVIVELTLKMVYDENV